MNEDATLVMKSKHKPVMHALANRLMDDNISFLYYGEAGHIEVPTESMEAVRNLQKIVKTYNLGDSIIFVERYD